MLCVLFKLFRPEGHRTENEVSKVCCIKTAKALLAKMLQQHETLPMHKFCLRDKWLIKNQILGSVR